jgi:hypothetical protein
VEGKVSFFQNSKYWHDTLFSKTLQVNADEENYIQLAQHVHAFWHLVRTELDFRNRLKPDDQMDDAKREAYPEGNLKIFATGERSSKTKSRTELSKSPNSIVSLTNNGLSVMKQSTSETAAKTELRALVALQRVPRVVRLLDVDPSSRALELELLKPVLWRSLYKDEKDIPRLREFMQSLVRSVCEVHAAGWAHRDLKPANIMCRPGDLLPVLLDFDAASTATTPHDAFEQHGTAGFTFWNSPATRAWQHDCVCLGVILGLVLGIDQFGNPDHDGIATLHHCLKEASDLPTGAADACRALLNGNPLKNVLLLPFFSPRAPLGQRSTNVR